MVLLSAAAAAPPRHPSSLTHGADPALKRGSEDSERSPSANSHQAAVNVTWAPSGARSTAQTCAQGGGGSSAQRGREGGGSSWCAYAGSLCAFLRVVVDTVCGHTYSDYAEVKATCPMRQTVKYNKYTSAVFTLQASTLNK